MLYIGQCKKLKKAFWDHKLTNNLGEKVYQVVFIFFFFKKITLPILNLI